MLQMGSSIFLNEQVASAMRCMYNGINGEEISEDFTQI